MFLRAEANELLVPLVPELDFLSAEIMMSSSSSGISSLTSSSSAGAAAAAAVPAVPWACFISSRAALGPRSLLSRFSAASVSFIEEEEEALEEDEGNKVEGKEEEEGAEKMLTGAFVGVEEAEAEVEGSPTTTADEPPDPLLLLAAKVCGCCCLMPLHKVNLCITAPDSFFRFIAFAS